MENQMEKNMEHEMGTGGIQGFIAVGFPKITGTFSGGPYNKDHSILGSTLGSPWLGELPYCYPEQSGDI